MASPVDDEKRDRNRSAQVTLYGEPLGDLGRRLMSSLGLTQAQLASTIGLSAPMLSQLMSAQRVKIGNPATVQRLQALSALTEQGELSHAEIASRLEEIKTSSAILNSTSLTTTHRPGLDPDAELARGIRGLLRAVASGHELQQVAATLDAEHPDLAAFIRVYGFGTADEARDHIARHKHLL